MRLLVATILFGCLAAASQATRLFMHSKPTCTRSSSSISRIFGQSFLSLALMTTLHPSTSFAQDQFRLPPIDRKDPNRCEMTSSSIGQANAGRDKLLDLRECDLKGKGAEGFDMSGIIASNADFSGVSFKEGQVSKGYMRNSKFVGCDFTNAVVDRVSFDGSDMKGAIFVNAVLSGTTFSDANLENTDFTDAYLGPFDLKNICLNPSLTGTNPVTKHDTKESAGCFN